MPEGCSIKTAGRLPSARSEGATGIITSEIAAAALAASRAQLEPSNEHFPPTSFIGAAIKDLDALQADLEAPQCRDRAVSIREIIAYLAFDNESLRQETLKRIFNVGPETIPYLQAAVNDSRPAMRCAAILALGYMESFRDGAPDEQVESVHLIKDAACGGDPALKTAARLALRYIATAPAIGHLIDQFKEAMEQEAKELLWHLALCRNPAIMNLGATNLSRKEFTLFLAEKFCGLETAGLAPEALAPFINARWFKEHSTNPLAQALALRFGLIDRGLYEACLQAPDLLNSREVYFLFDELGIATSLMLEILRASPADDKESLVLGWETRLAEFDQSLLPKSCGARELSRPLLLGTSPVARLDQELLFAALKLQDESNLKEKISPAPFSFRRRALKEQAFADLSLEDFIKSDLPLRELRARRFLQEAGAPPGVCAGLAADLVFEGLRQDCDTRQERAFEARLKSEAKFLSLARMLTEDGHRALIRPQYAQALRRIHPALGSAPRGIKSLVAGLGPAETALAVVNPERYCAGQALVENSRDLHTWHMLSFGSQAGLRLWAYKVASEGAAAQGEWQERCRDVYQEEARRRELYALSVGIELQYPGTPPHLVYAQKAACRLFGLDSPERSEFRALVEAASKPCFSSRALRLHLEGLLHLGFYPKPEYGIAMHVSLGKDLQQKAKFLAAGLLAIAPSLDQLLLCDADWEQGLAKILSKGFFYRARDAKPAGAKVHAPDALTEMRVARLWAQVQDADPQGTLLGLFDLAFPAVYDLGIAAAAALDLEQGGREVPPRLRALAGLWSAYQADITALYHQPDLGVKALFDCAWDESTGDTRDLKLLHELKLVKALAQLREFYLKHSDAGLALREGTLGLWMKYSRLVAEAMAIV